MENQEGKKEHVQENKKPRKKIMYAVSVIVIIVVIVAVFFLMRPSYTPERQYEEHFTGLESAAVVITEYSDFQCPACRQAYPVVEQIVNAYSNRTKFVYKHFPLTQIHQYAQKAAEASECAYDIGGNEKFWEYYHKLYNGISLSVDTLKRYASELGIDEKKFELCLDSGAMSSRVSMNLDEGRSLGIKGTPTFFINNEMFSGVRTFEEFKQIIDAKLG